MDRGTKASLNTCNIRMRLGHLFRISHEHILKQIPLVIDTVITEVGDEPYICINKSDIFRINLSGSWHKGYSQHLQHQDAAESSLQDFPVAYSESNSTPNPSIGLRRYLTSDEPVTIIPVCTRK